LANANKEEKMLEQSIYCKVDGTAIVLCDSDGNKMEDKTYFIDYHNKDYYELDIDANDTKYFSVKKLNDVEKNKIISIKTDDVEYKNDKVAINLNDDTISLLHGNLDTEYTFANNKHEMCTIYLDDEKKIDEEKSLKGGENKPKIIEENDETFGSYKKFFAGEGRENL